MNEFKNHGYKKPFGFYFEARTEPMIPPPPKVKHTIYFAAPKSFMDAMEKRDGDAILEKNIIEKGEIRDYFVRSVAKEFHPFMLFQNAVWSTGGLDITRQFKEAMELHQVPAWVIYVAAAEQARRLYRSDWVKSPRKRDRRRREPENVLELSQIRSMESMVRGDKLHC